MRDNSRGSGHTEVISNVITNEGHHGGFHLCLRVTMSLNMGILGRCTCTAQNDQHICVYVSYVTEPRKRPLFTLRPPMPPSAPEAPLHPPHPSPSHSHSLGHSYRPLGHLADHLETGWRCGYLEGRGRGGMCNEMGVQL